MSEPKIKVVFAPGAFDNLEMTQEEMDEFVKMIHDKVADGSLFTESRALDPDDPEDMETIERVAEAMEQSQNRKLQ
jgi:hypothetical protein